MVVFKIISFDLLVIRHCRINCIIWTKFCNDLISMGTMSTLKFVNYFFFHLDCNHFFFFFFLGGGGGEGV